MIKKYIQKNGKFVFFVAAVVAVFSYGAWTTSHFVLAFNETKRAHVFPTAVATVGWSSADNALYQDLPSSAPYGSFTQDNSAYLLIDTPASPETSPLTGSSDGSSSSSTVDTPTEAVVSDGSADTTPASESQQGSVPVPDADVPAAGPAPPISAPASDDKPPPEPPPADPAPPPEPADTTQSMRTDLLPIVLTHLQRYAAFAFSELVPTASAQTMEGADLIDLMSTTTISTDVPTSTAPVFPHATDTAAELPAPDDVPAPPTVVIDASDQSDIATCTITGEECHTIEVSGFSIGGSMEEKKFEGAELNFSFGGLVPENDIADGKLQVRYFHAGKWRSAGEIYLNKELSNGTNGGYFTAELDDISEWSDLADVKVVFEYVRGGQSAPIKLYLDAVWIDTIYKERAQDILAGDIIDGIPDAPDNVIEELVGRNTDATILVMSDGRRIEFPYLDNLNEDSLMIRSDKQRYRAPSPGAPADVYVSVTNTGADVDVFRLYASFPGGKGSVHSVKQYVHNVPKETSTPIREDVTYFCDEGWLASIAVEGQNATSTSDYQCAATEEVRTCTSLNKKGDNCLVEDDIIGMSTSTSYTSSWIDIGIDQDPGSDAVVVRGLPDGYRIASAMGEGLAILPGQTVYLRLSISTPDSESQRFVLSAAGDNYFGELNSLRLKYEASWVIETKVEGREKKSHVNEQLSNKVDFDIDELPEFRFKFQSQRSFFAHLKDLLFGKRVTYEVERATLRHASGETEHLPIDIEYGDQDEWVFKLSKQQRAFRPGKYTIELEMREGDQIFTDQIEFYWGVLAVNPDKSVYTIGETAQLSMAALDDNGNTMCDAQLSLSITSPSGNATNVPVISGGGCGHNNVTDLPDYIADLPVDEEGEYTLMLSHVNDSGDIINTTTDVFWGKKEVPYSVQRFGPTRIYPFSPYTTRMVITAKEAFNGTVREVLPEGFTVPDKGGATLVREDGVLYLTWDVALDAGETRTFSYQFKAPEVSPYLFLIGPLSIRSDDVTLFEEARVWKIASDALTIAAGVAWLSGTATTNGTELNNATAGALTWTTSDYDTTYFTHSTTTSNTQLTVNVAGDYLVAVDLPIERTDNRNDVTMLETDIRVNGVKRNMGVARSAYNERNSAKTSSEHVYILLNDLNEGDYIEAYVRAITTISAFDTIVIGSQASMYVEYIASSETVFNATATSTTAGTNINPASATKLQWYDSGYRVDGGYAHSNSSSPENITLGSTGSYMVHINMVASSTVANTRPRGRILVNGVLADGGHFKQSYIGGSSGATASSFQWSGVVTATTSSSTLTVDVQAAAAAGTATVINDVGSIYIQKLPAADVYYGRATTTSSGTNWNAASAVNVLWQMDDIKDTSAFTHSTATNAHQITVAKAGDYLLAFNDSMSGTVTRANPKVQVLVNGTARTGAQAKSNFISNSGGDAESSGSLVYLLRDLAISDVISFTTVADAAAGTVTAGQNALLMLWRKQQQSTFTQDTYRWYANDSASTTPSDPWPSGAVDLSEGGPLTTGTSIKSGNVVRLRLALQTSANTSAGADTFKLQYAAGSTCSPALTWSDVGGTSSSTIWRAYDNGSLTDGVTLASTTLSVSDVKMTYEEGNPTAATPNAMTASQDGEWDWVIEDNAADTGTDYCFRMVNSNGQALKDYTSYPQLVTNGTPGETTQTRMFDNEKTASTTPWFYFYASDPNGEDVDYQIQISTDQAFGSTVIDTDSQTNLDDFDNVDTPSDKSPFTSGQTIRYKVPSALTNNTTYWWRVRSKDTSGTGSFGSWSDSRSFTVDTSITIATWFQTTKEQFNTGTLSSVAATSTEDVSISSGSSGTIYSPSIDFDDKQTGNAWGTVSWTDLETLGTILYQVEYYTSTSSWNLIPDSEITGNSTGTTTSPITLTSLDTSTYNLIRVKATLTAVTGTPRLYDWTVNWALAVEPPTLSKPFDNEKTATTTPYFRFTTTDPQDNDLVYQIQWSSDPTFVTGVTSRVSDTNSGFSDISSTTLSSPFPSGDTIQYRIPSADALSNGTTYWWRVRAKDPAGGNAYSFWSDAYSFTVDTAITVATWFQTTTEQFETDSLQLTAAASGNVTVTTDVGKAAIYRSATAGESITTSTFTHGWDTSVRQDSVYSLSGTTTVLLSEGYYAVLYGVRYDSTGGLRRSVIQTGLNLATSSIPIGWSQGFMDRSGGVDAAFTSGGGIVYAEADNTPLKLQSFRTDANSGATLTRTNNTSGIQLIRLDSNWDYLRLSKVSTQTGPTSGTYVTVTYNNQDEVDTDSFGHTSGSGSITLKEAGHYLVFANTYGSLASGSTDPTGVIQKLVLNGTDVEGSFTTVFMRGNTNSNGIYEGAASIGMIINATTTNQVLTVQVARSLGTAAWTINADSSGTYVDRTAITIVNIPEADFIRLSDTGTNNINTASQTTFTWNTEDEKDSSWTHSTVTNPGRMQANTDGDYVLFASLYAQDAAVTDALYRQGWTKNGGTLLQYGQSGGYNYNNTTSDVGNWSGTIFHSLVNGDYVELVTLALGSAGTMSADKKAATGLRIGSLFESDTNSRTLTSSPIVFSSGDGPLWSTISWTNSQPVSTSIIYQVQYLTSTSSYNLVPDAALPNNSTGTTTSPIDISNLNRTTYGTLKLLATFTCGGGTCPTLNDWTVTWSEGVSISGTAKAFDQTTDVTSGTVEVAVNGVLQQDKIGTISAGSWTIPRVTMYQDDIVTVFVSDASTSTRAVAIAKYSGTGNITGMTLNQMHLTLGADNNALLTNANLSQYDYSVSGNFKIFHDVDAGNDLTVCNVSGCTDARLLIKTGTTYRPDSTSSGSVTTPNIQINGALVADGNTINVSRSWKNNATFDKGSSLVVFTATSSTETIDSSSATSSAFFMMTFGQTSGTARWSLSSPLVASSTMTISYGTLAPGATSTISLSGDLSIGASGVFSKSAASTTFAGSGSSTWTDSSSAKQDMGDLYIDGSSKTVVLGSSVKATNITIGANDVLDATASYTIEVVGDWTNNNTFTARTGTVSFIATSTGRTITPGTSAFYNMTFNGTGGNWSFSSQTATSSNDLTITAGTVTLPTATTTVGGSFTASTGTFMHNNGAVIFNTSGSKTIDPGASSFYDTVFNGSGSWSFSATNATSSRHMTITAGTLTAPSGTLVVGGSYAKNGGTFTHNSGTLKFTSGSTATVKLGGSDAYNVTFDGAGGLWTFTDTNATTTNSFTVTNGSTTLPAGVLAVGGSFVNTGVFTHNSGTVKFNASATGKSVTTGGNSFYNLSFDSSSGGWTITDNATSTNNTTLTNASDFMLTSGKSLAVGGTFTNSVAGAATTWTGSTLYLYSTTTYSINTKTSAAEVYGTIKVGLGTDIRMWNSTSTVSLSGATGSLFSQDHNNVDGDLYIFGAYTATTGENWAYATDFDGTALGGGSRKVNVKIASSSVIIFTAGTHTLVGGASASTTVSNQGVGAYSFSMTGGTLNAQYYQFRNMDATGVSLSGAPTITSLADGDFELSANGGTTMTITSTVINANPTLQIQRVRFATSTGITTAYNVTESGTPTSYWWFRNHYGDLDGEAYDNDPDGNPGYIQWDDSGFTITVAGNVYSDHGSTAIGNPPCDGSTARVKIVTSGGDTYTGSCNAGTGAYSIPNVFFRAGGTVAVYLDTDGGKRGVTVTRSATANLSDMHIYQNAVILRHEDANPLLNSDLTTVDSSFDSDIPFAISSGNMIVSPETELYIWTGKTYAPGGNVTLQSGGSGSAADGLFYLATSSVFTAAGSQAHSIGGGLYIGSSATFTAANSTVTFTATTTGKTIYAYQAATLYNVVFNGSGGGWSFTGSSAATTTMNSLTLTAGTVAGTGPIDIQTGGVTGSGVFAMTGGTVRFQGTGDFGNNNAWQFNNVMFGNASAVSTTTKVGLATTTVTGVLSVTSNGVLKAGSYPWVLSGSGVPLVIAGTFDVETAAFHYTGTSAVTVADADYAALVLAPSGAGSPTYTLSGGTPSIASLTIGDSTNPVTVTANTNDPSISVSGSVTINTSAILVASNVGAFDVLGSWTNNGTFTHSNGVVTFAATATGKTINAGSSSFYDLTFNSSSGGWTISANATSTHNTTITSASSFTLSSGVTLEVGGTFTNSVGGGSTTWTGSTLYLNSGTSYSMNTKIAGGDAYGTLKVGASTHVRSWNSSATTVDVNTTGSLYSQDHAAVDGALYIWGAYARSSGSDYWSYGTDFDGTDISTTTPREVNVSIASSSSISYSGGVLDIIGSASASTTIANQGAGAYAFSVSGGTFNANYYEFRNMDSNGVSLSGSPTVSSLAYGDYELSAPGGTTMTVAGSVVTANPLAVIQRVRFATTSGITSGYNVTGTGSTASFWKFNLHYGNYAGESYDNDPTGNPGFIRWDDSADQITISGNVYSDEGSTVSTVCDSSTQVVRLKVEGSGSYTSSCNSSTGAYSIPNVSFNPGDTFTVFLDTNGGRRAADITIDALASVSGVHLYENRVIVRHEGASPITIADMTRYDSDEDTDIPFDATDAATDTLVVTPDTELMVWDSMTFAPAGDVTLQSGGSGNAYDGSLEVRTGGTFSAAGTQTHSIGGSFVIGSSATFTSGNSTVVFTATTTGKTITPGTSTFYNITFNGSGGNWAFGQANATSTNDVAVTNGTLTLPTNRLEVLGSFTNTGGTFMHNNGTLYLTATASGKDIRAGGSSFYNIMASSTSGGWSFLDTNATSSNDVTINAGTLTLPSGIFAIGGSLDNQSTLTSNSGTVKFTSNTTGETIRTTGSSFYNVTFDGVGGAWSFTDTNATTTNNITITNGTTTMPSGIFAVGGSFANTAAFTHNSGTVKFNATATGKTISVATSTFYDLTFDSSSGGWTISANATSTHNTTITSASSFALASGATLEVDGTFTNSVGGGSTTWTGSTLYLNSGTSYSMNTKSAGGDTYGTITLGASTRVSSWDSDASTLNVGASAYLYSQDHAGTAGSLYIFGTYTRSSGTEYWSYATDFDGTALGGSSRQVNVRIATSSSVSFTSATLNMVGTASATTTVRASGTSEYAFSVAGGTLNAQYYEFKNLDATGVSISGYPVVSSLDYGYIEMSTASGTAMTLTSTVIDANANLSISTVGFATTSSNNTGFNVTLFGNAGSSWTFTGHWGNLDGEAHDYDGATACGDVRWDDSSCQFVNQAHYRWRNDDGGEAVPTSDWYNASWGKRKRIGITNPNATAYTDIPVKIEVPYDADMQADFDDLRFTDSTGTTTLSFWRESTINSGTTTVWVKIPSLSSSGTAIIYAYYNNGSATTSDSSTNTFSFIDDFEDNNISEYSGDTGGSYFSTSASFDHNGTYGLAGSGVSGQTPNGIYRTGALTAQGKTIRWFQYVDTGFDDEPCTFFGVQANPTAGSYGVCLDEYPSDQLAIVRDAHSNDGSGTTMATTSVTYATAWYEVVVDWLTTNTINVTVYNDAGSVFASLSTTTSTYTSGGMGFGHFNQNGGWDTYMVKPYTAVAPTYVFGAEQGSGGASWKAAQDTELSGSSGLNIGDNVRLRFSVQNTGTSVSGQLFRLQVAPKGASISCAAVPYEDFDDVPTATAGCGTATACMSTSTQFTDQAATGGLLSYPAAMSFSAGQILEDPSNQTSSTTLSANTATEIEYNFKMTSNATGDAYCFRTSNGGIDLGNYDWVAEATVIHPPVISNLTLNSATNITLTEGTTTTVIASCTVTDDNGYADISSGTSTIYRSALGASCTADENNCYQMAAASCALSSCSGSSCTLTCTSSVQYFAEPTDTGTTYEAQNWLASIAVEDSSGLRDTETAIGVEMLSTYGLSITTGGLDFGSLEVGQNTGAVNATTTLRNTGNRNIDIRVSGDDLTAGANTISVGAQKYATTTFTYSACSICQFLTGSATNVGVNLSKPTSTSTPITDDVYFGITVPSGKAAAAYSGINYFDAVTPP